LKDNFGDAGWLCSPFAFECCLKGDASAARCVIDRKHFDACAQLRADTRFDAMKIIAYTAHAMPEEIAQLEAAGFNHILLKPIRSNELLQALTA
jgi:CheY-like chemotaxis protein